MAKHGKGRRKRWLKPWVNVGITLSTLANNAVIAAANSDVAVEPILITSVEGLYSMTGQTAGEGPKLIGVAHSDYTGAEILEYLENTGSWDIGDLVQQESSKRKIRIIGYFPSTDEDEVLADGKTIKTKLNWRIDAGATLQLFVYNQSGATLTTGALAHLDGSLNAFML